MLIKYYKGGQIKENGLGGACSTYGGREEMFVRRPEGKGPLGSGSCAWKDNTKMEFVAGSTGLRETGNLYRGADKSLARPERQQGTATEDFGVNISYL